MVGVVVIGAATARAFLPDAGLATTREALETVFAFGAEAAERAPSAFAVGADSGFAGASAAALGEPALSGLAAASCDAAAGSALRALAVLLSALGFAAAVSAAAKAAPPIHDSVRLRARIEPVATTRAGSPLRGAELRRLLGIGLSFLMFGGSGRRRRRRG